jgi:hypothetical protein
MRNVLTLSEDKTALLVKKNSKPPPSPSLKSKIDKFRATPRGQIVFFNCAVWTVERLERSGLTLPEWARTGYALSAIGIGIESSRTELQPRIPEAPRWYTESEAGKAFETWDAYWRGSLHNRFYYFFHCTEGDEFSKHPPGIYEWPGSVSKDGKRLLFWR